MLEHRQTRPARSTCPCHRRISGKGAQPYARVEDEFWQDCGKELAAAGNEKPGKMSIYVRLQGRITGCFVSYRWWQPKLPTTRSSVTIGQR